MSLTSWGGVWNSYLIISFTDTNKTNWVHSWNSLAGWLLSLEGLGRGLGKLWTDTRPQSRLNTGIPSWKNYRHSLSLPTGILNIQLALKSLHAFDRWNVSAYLICMSRYPDMPLQDELSNLLYHTTWKFF